MKFNHNDVSGEIFETIQESGEVPEKVWKNLTEKKCTCGDTESQHYENTDKCVVCGCKEFEEKLDTELRQEIIKTLKAIQDYCNR